MCVGMVPTGRHLDKHPWRLALLFWHSPWYKSYKNTSRAGPRHYTYIRETKVGGFNQSSATVVHKSPDPPLSYCMHTCPIQHFWHLCMLHDFHANIQVDGVILVCNLTQWNGKRITITTKCCTFAFSSTNITAFTTCNAIVSIQSE